MKPALVLADSCSPGRQGVIDATAEFDEDDLGDELDEHAGALGGRKRGRSPRIYEIATDCPPSCRYGIIPRH